MHLVPSYAGCDPIEAEIRRRVWAGVVTLEATTSSNLGLPPAITDHNLDDLAPADVEDEDLATNVALEPGLRFTSSTFYCLCYKLYCLQLSILDKLYYRVKPGRPDTTAMLELDKRLDTWRTQIPPELAFVASASTRKAEIVLQSTVLRQRMLTTRQLLHRPSLSMLCLVDGPLSRCEHVLAMSSAQLCCKAAIALINSLQVNIHSECSGAWCWFCCHSAAPASLTDVMNRVAAALRVLRSDDSGGRLPC